GAVVWPDYDNVSWGERCGVVVDQIVVAVDIQSVPVVCRGVSGYDEIVSLNQHPRKPIIVESIVHDSGIAFCELCSRPDGYDVVVSKIHVRGRMGIDAVPVAIVSDSVVDYVEI